MRGTWTCIAVLTGLIATRGAAADSETAAPAFAALEPDITIDDHDRRRLDEGDVLVRILPASGRELAVLAAGALNVGADQFVAHVEDIAALKRSKAVPEIGRFSTPPQLADLDGLTLDEDDLRALRECRADDCDLKLSRSEVEEFQHDTANRGDHEWALAANIAFRRIVLARVIAYLASGLPGIPAYDTDRRPASLPSIFSTLLHHTPFMQTQAPLLSSYLERYPAMRPSHQVVASFLYWSKEQYAWKPVISVTHVIIARPAPQSDQSPEVVAVSREVFSTRYTSGSFVLTLLLRSAAPAVRHYLVYENRTWADGVRALWRPFVEHFVKSHASKLFNSARMRIEQAPAEH